MKAVNLVPLVLDLLLQTTDEFVGVEECKLFVTKTIFKVQEACRRLVFCPHAHLVSSKFGRLIRRCRLCSFLCIASPMVFIPFLLSVGGLSFPVPLLLLVTLSAMVWIHGLTKGPAVVFGGAEEAEDFDAEVTETNIRDVVLVTASNACCLPPLVAPEDNLLLDVLFWLRTILIHRKAFGAILRHLAPWRTVGGRARCRHDSPLK
jgi:hypothetical protein